MRRVRMLPEVAAAVRDGRPVVALETAVVTAGLPRLPLESPPDFDAPDWNETAPVHLEAGRLLQRIVRSAGAIPAMVGILDGTLLIGLDDDDLDRLARAEHAAKAAAADVASTLLRGGTAGTTVSATLLACRLASPAPIRVFATGGIGGVHRGWTSHPDVSADLVELARSPVCVVCSGAKSILDLPATLEALATLGVPVLGYQTDAFPQFVSPPACDLPVSHRVNTIDDAAAVCHLHLDDLAMPGGLLLAQAVPEPHGIAAADLEPLLEQAEADAATHGVTG
ncbi:MAG: pseudouridine-5'-phosphate glycosidase, partial [Planctomycetota bacterium]